jgi:ribosome-associated translation inhibitor RaiA
LIKGKKLKTKIAAGVIAVGVITGSGIVFANTDAGTKLREWYQGMFGETVSSIEDQVTAYGESKIPGLEQEYEGLKTQAQLDIDLSRELETGESLEEIINAKLSHIESLSDEERAILEGIGQEFYNVFLDGYFEITRLQEEGLQYATNDLTTYTGELGQAAMDEMTADINTAKDQAVQELEDAIRQAQERLAMELENQEEITVRNLKNQIDWRIQELRQEVTALLETLVAEQEAIIVAKAQELEDNAKAALDEVVNNIN